MTDALQRGGSLASGEVVRVTVGHSLETWVSRLDFVRVVYSAHVAPDIPCALVIKRPRQGSMPETSFDRAEQEFYRHLAGELPMPPVVRCLAALDDVEGAPALVLQDLRESHHHRPWPVPPSEAESEMAVDALAVIHANWWEHALLGRTIGHGHTEQSLRAMVRGISDHLPGFLATFGSSLPQATRTILQRVFSSSLHPWLRLADPRALTVAHGDAHGWNVLFPRSGEGSAYLLDWQLWHLDVGVRDLAYLIALHWSPARRRELELDLLHRYHEQLMQLGVTGYAFDELFLDYRRCVVRNLTFPILFCRRGMAIERWWYRLEHAIAAYQELDGDELL